MVNPAMVFTPDHIDEVGRANLNAALGFNAFAYAFTISYTDETGFIAKWPTAFHRIAQRLAASTEAARTGGATLTGHTATRRGRGLFDLYVAFELGRVPASTQQLTDLLTAIRAMTFHELDVPRGPGLYAQHVGFWAFGHITHANQYLLDLRARLGGIGYAPSLDPVAQVPIGVPGEPQIRGVTQVERDIATISDENERLAAALGLMVARVENLESYFMAAEEALPGVAGGEEYYRAVIGPMREIQAQVKAQTEEIARMLAEAVAANDPITADPGQSLIRYAAVAAGGVAAVLIAQRAFK